MINITGSFALGLFLAWSAARSIADQRWRLLIAVGFCGGYTTYSGFAFESFTLLAARQFSAFIWNFLITNVCCLGATALGVYLGRALGAARQR